MSDTSHKSGIGPTPKVPKWSLKFGWGPVDHEALWLLQRGRCGICQRDLTGKRAFLDHDQQKGMIRGFLCYWCNRFYVAKNTLASAEKVIAYLRSPPAAAGLVTAASYAGGAVGSGG